MADSVAGGPGQSFPFTRREAIGTLAAGAVASGAAAWTFGASERRPRIAAVVTTYRWMEHGQGIVDRFLEGYGWQGLHHQPAVDVVSLFVDQRRAGDLSQERATRHPTMRIFPTIAEALTRGGSTLEVDGVVVIGEHGRYPRNDRGQTLYPRFEFFQQVVEVFRRTGKVVPVFNDKHLSWNWDHARSMVDTAHRMGFPFMAGSSLPVTWRIPAAETPLGAEVEEVVCVGYGGVDSYDIHGLETLQCMVERRSGGETGVRAVQALRGPEVWKRLAQEKWGPGDPSGRLLESCLCRSFRLASPRPGYGHVLPTLEQLPGLVPLPFLYRLEYRDGLKGTLLMLDSLVNDFTVSLRIKGNRTPLSTQMYLPGLHPGQTLPNFFSPLAHHIETMVLTGKPPYPVERTLLTTGILCAAIESLSRNGARIETPQLESVAYQPPRESTFLRS